MLFCFIVFKALVHLASLLLLGYLSPGRFGAGRYPEHQPADRTLHLNRLLQGEHQQAADGHDTTQAGGFAQGIVQGYTKKLGIKL